MSEVSAAEADCSDLWQRSVAAAARWTTVHHVLIPHGCRMHITIPISTILGNLTCYRLILTWSTMTHVGTTWKTLIVYKSFFARGSRDLVNEIDNYSWKLKSDILEDIPTCTKLGQVWSTPFMLFSFSFFLSFRWEMLKLNLCFYNYRPGLNVVKL